MKFKKNNRIFENTFFILLAIAFIIPLVLLLSISVSNETDIATFGFRFIPKQIDLTAYKFLFSNPARLLNAYKVTIIVSVVGTVIYLIIASLAAYALSRDTFKFRKQISFFLFFTLLFNGGMVPTYILMANILNLRNTYVALILPLLSNVWFLIILRTFFLQLPKALVESAKIDGASEIKILFLIILPLSTPALATVGLFQLLNYWNAWFEAQMYIDKQTMYPLQYLLQVTLRNIQEVSKNMLGKQLSMSAQNIPSESMRMAMAILAAVPMLIIFPLFQKYFVKGVIVGAVKG